MGASSPDTSGAAKVTADASLEASRIQAASEAENRALQEKLFNQQQDYLNQQDTYNKGLTVQNQQNYQPYIDAGGQGLSALTSATTDPNSWFNQTFTGDDLQNDAGYQFRLSQGQNALNNNLAATKGLLSGAAIKAGEQYNSGMASDEFNNAYSRFTNDKNNRYSALSGLAQMGLQGANGFAGASTQSTTGTQLANVTGQYGSNLSNIITNGANNQANIQLANAKQQAQLMMAQGGGTSPLAGAAAGASAGAAFGPWGALAGGVIGGLSTMV